MVESQNDFFILWYTIYFLGAANLFISSVTCFFIILSHKKYLAEKRNLARIRADDIKYG